MPSHQSEIHHHVTIAHSHPATPSPPHLSNHQHLPQQQYWCLCLQALSPPTSWSTSPTQTCGNCNTATNKISTTTATTTQRNVQYASPQVITYPLCCFLFSPPLLSTKHICTTCYRLLFILSHTAYIPALVHISIWHNLSPNLSPHVQFYPIPLISPPLLIKKKRRVITTNVKHHNLPSIFHGALTLCDPPNVLINSHPIFFLS